MVFTQNCQGNKNTIETGIKKSNVSFIGGIVALGGGTAVAQVIGILTIPILSRLFLPEAYGLAALFLSFPSIIAGLGSLRYEESIMLPKDDEDAANLFSLCLILLTAATALLTIAFIFCRNSIADWLNVQQLKPYIWLWPICFFLLSIVAPLQYWNYRQKSFKKLGGVRIADSAAGRVVKIAGGFLGFTSGGNLILFDLLNLVTAPAILLGRMARADVRYIFRYLNLRRILTLARRYKRFPLFMSWCVLLNNISRNMPLIILASFFGTSTVGLYSMAFALVQLPTSIISEATGQVLFQRASSRFAAGEDIRPAIVNVFQQLAMISLCPVGILMVLGPQFAAFFLGPKWADSGLYTAILSPLLLITFVTSPLLFLFLVFEKQSQYLIFNIALFAARVGSLLFGGYILHNAKLTIGCFSAAGCFVFAYGLYYILKTANVSLKNMIRPIISSLLYSAICIAVIAICKWLLHLPMLVLFLVAAATSVLYFALLIWRIDIFRRQALKTLQLLQSHLPRKQMAVCPLNES